MIDRWQRLEQLMGAVAKNDLAALKAIRSEQDVIEMRRLDLLAARRSVETGDVLQADTVYTPDRADAHIRWIDQELSTLNTRLAQLRVEYEVVHGRATKSFGREQALKGLIARWRG